MKAQDKEEIVFCILWDIIKKKKGQAELSDIWAEYLSKIHEIKEAYGIDLGEVNWQEILNKFPKKRKRYKLPEVLAEPVSPEEMIKNLKIRRVEITPEMELELLRDENVKLRKEKFEYEKQIREMEFLKKSADDFLRVWGHSSEDILRSLQNIEEYICKVPKDEVPIYFEFLIAEAFSCIYQLPLYTQEIAQQEAVMNQVMWRGKTDLTGRPISWAPGGGPDVIVNAFGYHVLVESTLTTGNIQWTREFAPIVRHLREYIDYKELEKSDVYMLFVVKEIADDTFASLVDQAKKGFNTIPLTVDLLEHIVETAFYLPFIPHAEVRSLLNAFQEKLATSYTIDEYVGIVKEEVLHWEKNILKDHEDLYLALNAYNIIERSKRKFITVDDLFEVLNQEEKVGRFYDLIERILRKETIVRCLLYYGLAQSQRFAGDIILRAVPWNEFRSRMFKILGAFSKMRA